MKHHPRIWLEEPYALLLEANMQPEISLHPRSRGAIEFLSVSEAEEFIASILATAKETGDMPMRDRQAYTIPEFCGIYAISRAMFYKLRKQGTGPEIFKVGGRTLISRVAAEDWLRKLTRA